MSSDVIGDFQEPYGAVSVEGDDMAALSPTGFESGADAGARGPRWRQSAGTQPVQRNPRSHFLHYRDSRSC